jgi:hypothetical protein
MGLTVSCARSLPRVCADEDLEGMFPENGPGRGVVLEEETEDERWLPLGTRLWRSVLEGEPKTGELSAGLGLAIASSLPESKGVFEESIK